jgi:hypothetical protein
MITGRTCRLLSLILELEHGRLHQTQHRNSLLLGGRQPRQHPFRLLEAAPDRRRRKLRQLRQSRQTRWLRGMGCRLNAQTMCASERAIESEGSLMQSVKTSVQKLLHCQKWINLAP